ncbi:MAG: prepilin-type N-terminal cleavage/methylation domain-containing protein [Candidatus Saccharibacteria bacterium]|nr:prepilin-type N-terminal cleavage/methylation domain-containing protein [Candidatus Saccharibacteria bacterium]
MLRNLIKKGQKGFTIIEVMIVLAIAGLILVVVLVAVPQLQRNQRNEARKSILARINTEIANYSGNNNGSIPTDQGDLDGVTSRYLSNIDIKDPSTDQNVVLTEGAPPASGSSTPTATQAVASYLSGYICDGENIESSTARSYAVWTLLEGGAIYCIDNL